MRVVLLFLTSLIAFSVAEKFVKIEGTSGEFSQILVDSTGRWYIVKNKSLYYSFDAGITLNKIELPSKESVHTGVGIDNFDNIYVQDYNLTVFVIAPGLGTSFVFEEITLAYGKERVVNKPFSHYSSVYLATKSGLMYLEYGDIKCKALNSPPTSRKEITHLIHYEYGNPNREGLFYSGGYPRYWVYKNIGFSHEAVCQTRSFVNFMEKADYYVYFTVNGVKEVYVTQSRVTSLCTTVNGIDASNIINQTDFVVYSPSKDKTYIYGNVNNTGTIYELRETVVNKIVQVASTHQLINNVRVICGAVESSRIYLGTSDGVYRLTDI